VQRVRIQDDFDQWRSAARALLAADVAPDQVAWVEEALEGAMIPGVIDAAGTPAASGGGAKQGAPREIRVPRAFVDRARVIARHSDPARWALLYRVLWRLTHGEVHLLDLDADEDVRALVSMEMQVRAARQPEPPPNDGHEQLFKPHAPRGVEEMMARKTDEFPTAEPFLPERLSLPAMREAVDGCRGCPLYKNATQGVFGEGPKSALAVFVGEQPGDQEDLAGKPFVGPAGQLFDNVLERVGIDRKDLYVTNAVKHFKWEPRGKRRIHVKPSAREIQACKPWMVAEVQVIKPPIVVAMGATAAQALLGPTVRITKDRGHPRESQWAPWTMVTVHPSALLRAPDEDMRDKMMGEFTEDLRKVAREIKRVKEKNGS
jgi:DNA polymerase